MNLSALSHNFTIFAGADGYRIHSGGGEISHEWMSPPSLTILLRDKPAASMMKTTNIFPPFLLLGGAVVALLLSASLPLASGQLCCVCFDDCVSTITNPDALFPIPENDEPLLEGITEATKIFS